MAPVVRRLVGGTLVERFGDYARDLKEFAEREHSGGGGENAVVDE